ncbi:unnamed protein product, partial [Meganyctiphanes norvegica]
VNKVLLGELEYGETSYQLCLQHRDIPVSPNPTEAIIEAVQCSNKTIIVLSRNFIENDLSILYSAAIKQELLLHQMILIMTSDISVFNLTPEIQAILNSSLVIQSNDARLWQKLRMVVPKVALSRTQNSDTTYTPRSDSSQSSVATSNYNMNCSRDKLKDHIYDHCSKDTLTDHIYDHP